MDGIEEAWHLTDRAPQAWPLRDGFVNPSEGPAR